VRYNKGKTANYATFKLLNKNNQTSLVTTVGKNQNAAMSTLQEVGTVSMA